MILYGKENKKLLTFYKLIDMYIMKKGDVGMTIKNKFKENKKFREKS